MPQSLPAYVFGVDFGTDSVRALLVDAHDGTELASAVFAYPRWRDGLFCDPPNKQFRQHPLDYIEGLEASIRQCLAIAGPDAARHVMGISIDSTGSTPVAVNNKGVPLGLIPGFETNPNALFVLWKDHSALAEAEAINRHAEKFDIDYLADVGGIYSSEWFWAKLLHILRVDPSIRQSIHSWVEHCDWIPFLLTGGQSHDQLKRGRCAAGHKALWSPRFGGYPPNEFFKSLDPLLDGFVDRLPSDSYTADRPAGRLCPEWAEKLGLHTDVVVGIGAFDAHMGAVGGQIIPYHLSKVMGTSTCDMMVAPLTALQDRTVRGICGQVEGSVIPGMMGLEAGQSAFGDVYAWLARLLAEPLREMISLTTTLPATQTDKDLEARLLNFLLEKAAKQPIREELPLALDWLNGRRTPDANQALKAAISNLDLSTGISEISYALVEATCFGARAITDRFAEEGVPVQGIIGLGGVACKSPFIMQLLANVLQMPIRIHKSDQTCALGAAMFAATAAGLYPRVEEAMEAMGPGFENSIEPDSACREILDKRYAQYRKLGESISQ